MPSNECITYVEASYTQKITVNVGYAVTGKTFAGPLLGYQTAGEPGLAADPLATYDGGTLTVPAAPSAGGEVSGVVNWDVAQHGFAVLTRGAGTVLPVTSGAAITAGANLKVDTSGRVVTATTGSVVVGKALSTVAGSGLDTVVELFDLNPAVLSA